jgi:hypothetical protein
MTSIHSNLPLHDAAQIQPSLSRSLRSLSERARPAVQQPDGDAEPAPEAPDARAAIVLQNQFSALADPAEAAAANRSAAASIASAPAGALSAQSLLDPSDVAQLVSGE